MQTRQAIVVAVDGPGGAGKGTLCQLLAAEFGFALLDSGALYRLTALAAQRQGVDFDDEAALAQVAANLDVRFDAGEQGQGVTTWLQGEVVGNELRTEQTGGLASKVAALTPVRDALLQRQRDFAQVPGLVADGRDMGTVVFPEAALKIYLTAGAEERAQRRYLQLRDKGQLSDDELQGEGRNVTLARLLEEINLRDERDSNRAVAPLRPAKDAQIIDSTAMSIEEVKAAVVAFAKERGLI
ncbi:cytidylate kinase [Sinobacterium caligoides]|uniref:Cytidylate kinase n=1 Tax=Sinobacterium caligoides TaxID=933926 RepID=A0A3N2DZR0_9GAMM|nr:(d)CMP kinase [Sinobacterium caligoides]ROS05132.1 cytidylate kinase [Sinobacterium caligoides]